MGAQVERWEYLNPGKTLAETLDISHKTLLYVEGSRSASMASAR
jgi:urea transport system ATP-binding protein